MRTDSSTLFFHGKRDAGYTSPQHVSKAGVSIVRQRVKLNITEALHEKVLLFCIQRRPMKSAGCKTHRHCRFQQIVASSFWEFLEPQRGIRNTMKHPAYAAPQGGINLPQLIECRHDGRIRQFECGAQ